MERYRIFIRRHYIAIKYYDVLAKDKKTAKRGALKAVKKILPDARKIATDNGWIAEEPAEIPYLGYASSTPFKVEEIFEDRKSGTVVYERIN